MEPEINPEARTLALDILERLPYEPNYQQMQVAMALARFITRRDDTSTDRVFILNGYAGTGKTTLTGALVKALAARKTETVLLAPTGRAAKVFAAGAGAPASTIHRRIYTHVMPGAKGGPSMRENRTHNAVFIVDEASMIGGSDGQSDLLGDLVRYVFAGFESRLILLGDTAQLPPVGQQLSPAMNPEVLHALGLKVSRATLTEVARQGAGSMILANATRLRRALASTAPGTCAIVPLRTGGDVIALPPDEVSDTFDTLYRSEGVENTVLITRSNRTASDYNSAIRSQILLYEEELVPGDLLVAAKNNYFWTRKTKGLSFVANGEILRLERVLGSEIRYGMRFADVELSLPDNPEVRFTAKIVLTALTSASAAIDPDAGRRLFEGVFRDPDLHAPGASEAERLKAMAASPFWNALQLKYAYAVTCHKAQGGQWRNVVVDLGYVPPEETGPEFFRWLYTAVTRATGRLYLLNPPEALLD